MTTTVINDIRRYNFTNRDNLLLDANILLSVHGPNANQEKFTYIYSDALYKMRVCGCQIFIDVLVLSEFINRFSRWAYDQLPPEDRAKYLEFKDFRKSSEFKQVAEEIADNAWRISEYAKCSDSEFGSANIDDLLSEYSLGNSDFNDLILIHLCQNRGLTLVTHDGDFIESDIKILTANSRLLRATR